MATDFRLSTDEFLTKTIKDLAAQSNAILLAQLEDLVSRDLLVVEQSYPTIVRSMAEDKFELRQTIKLTLKDKEYIIKLEEENKQLKEQLEALTKAITGVLKL